MLGTWSYSLYLVHLSVIHWLLGVVVPHPTTWHDAKVTLVWACVATLLAGACYRFIEHPAEAALRRMYPRRSTRAAGSGRDGTRTAGSERDGTRTAGSHRSDAGLDQVPVLSGDVETRAPAPSQG